MSAAQGFAVSPAEASVEMGTSITGQIASTIANAALNSPTALAPSVVSSLTSMSLAQATPQEIGQQAMAMGVSPVGPFGGPPSGPGWGLAPLAPPQWEPAAPQAPQPGGTEEAPTAEFAPPPSGDGGGFQVASTQFDQPTNQVALGFEPTSNILSPAEMPSPSEQGGVFAPSGSTTPESGGAALAGLFGGLGGAAPVGGGDLGGYSGYTAFVPDVGEINPAGWNAFMSSAPLSTNVEDRTVEGYDPGPNTVAGYLSGTSPDALADKNYMEMPSADLELTQQLGYGSISPSPLPQGEPHEMTTQEMDRAIEKLEERASTPAWETPTPPPAAPEGGRAVNPLQQGPGAPAYAGGTGEKTMATTPEEQARTVQENTASQLPASIGLPEVTVKAGDVTPNLSPGGSTQTAGAVPDMENPSGPLGGMATGDLTASERAQNISTPSEGPTREAPSPSVTQEEAAPKAGDRENADTMREAPGREEGKVEPEAPSGGLGIITEAEARRGGAHAAAANMERFNVPGEKFVPPNATQEQIDAGKNPDREAQRDTQLQQLRSQPGNVAGQPDATALDRFATIVAREGGNNLAKSTAIAESILNRANTHFGGDVTKAIAESQFQQGTRYFPNTSDPARAGDQPTNITWEAVRNAFSGSNVARGATGNETGSRVTNFLGNNMVVGIGQGVNAERLGMEGQGARWQAAEMGRGGQPQPLPQTAGTDPDHAGFTPTIATPGQQNGHVAVSQGDRAYPAGVPALQAIAQAIFGADARIDRYGNLVASRQPTQGAAAINGLLTIIGPQGTIQVPMNSGGHGRGDMPSSIVPIDATREHGGTATNSGLGARYDGIARAGGIGAIPGERYVADPSPGRGGQIGDRSSMELHAHPGESVLAGSAGCLSVPGGVNGPYWGDARSAFLQAAQQGQQLYAVTDRAGHTVIGTANDLQIYYGTAPAIAQNLPAASPGNFPGGGRDIAYDYRPPAMTAPIAAPAPALPSGMDIEFTPRGFERGPAAAAVPTPEELGGGHRQAAVEPSTAEMQMGGQFFPADPFDARFGNLPSAEQFLSAPGWQFPGGGRDAVYDAVVAGLPMLGIGPDVLQPGQEGPGQGGLPLGAPGGGEALQTNQQAPGEVAGIPMWSPAEQRQGQSGAFGEPPLIRGTTGLPVAAGPANPVTPVERAGALPPAIAPDTFAERFGNLPPAESGQFTDRFGNLPPAQDIINPAITGPGLGAPNPDNIVTSMSLEEPRAAIAGATDADTEERIAQDRAAVAGATDADTEQPSEERFAAPDFITGPKPPAPALTGLQIFDRIERARQAQLSPADRAQAQKYSAYATPQDKQQLLDGRITPLDFMVRIANREPGILITRTPAMIQQYGADALRTLTAGVHEARAQMAQQSQAAQTFASERAAFEGKMGATPQMIAAVNAPSTTEQPAVAAPAAEMPSGMDIEFDPLGNVIGPMTSLPGGIPAFPFPGSFPPGIHEQAIPIEPAPTAPVVPPSGPSAPAAPGALPSAPPGAPSAPGPGVGPPSVSGVPMAAGAAPGVSAEMSYFVLSNYPEEVQQVARRFGVDMMTAAAIVVASSMAGQPTQAMAEGGYPQAGQPVLVGEHGPEVFVPRQSGTVLPNPRDLPGQLGLGDIPPPGRGGPWDWDRVFIPGNEYGYGPTALGERVHPSAWDMWLRGLPESENIEDRRGTPGYSGQYRREWK